MRFQTRTVLVVPAVAAVVLTGCAKTLTAGDIESDIEGEFSNRGFTVESVSCPDDIEAKSGETGECSLTANGVTVPVEIDVTSEDGAYNFEIPPSEARKLEAATKG
jgi:hypothetical protein